MEKFGFSSLKYIYLKQIFCQWLTTQVDTMNYSLGVLFFLICLCSIIWLGKMFRYEFLLRKLRKKIESLLPDAAFILDVPFRVLLSNHYSSKDFPFFYEEVIGANLWEVLPSEFVARIYKGYKDAINTKKRQTVRFVFPWKYEKIIELEVRFIPLRYKYILCVLRNVKEKKIDK